MDKQGIIKHKVIFDQWLQGKQIEVRNNDNWFTSDIPSWDSCLEYRLYNKHRALMDICEKDPSTQLQFKSYDVRNQGTWCDVIGPPIWGNDEYRIKPHDHKELKALYKLYPNLQLEYQYTINSISWVKLTSLPSWSDHLKYRIKPMTDIQKIDFYLKNSIDVSTDFVISETDKLLNLE